jgi:hypothetical protein
VTPPYAAELRVYEPLGAFPPPERRVWERYAASGRVPAPRDGARHERLLGLRVACQTSPRVPRPGEATAQAYVLGGESGLLICPLRTELRAWEAAGEVGELLSTEVAAMALPEEERDFAAGEHEGWITRHPELRGHILTSRWAVPVRWFLLFDREERRLQLGPAGQTVTDPMPGTAATAVGRSLIYRTAMSKARRRLARGLSVLRKSFDEGPVVVAVESVGRWLEEFHPRSVVELDYGGIVDIRSDSDLRTDDSAGDVAEALSALGRGDGPAASKAYDRVIDRWRSAHRVESAN